MPKRKFGISVERELAEELDGLAARLGVERSALVERALREMLKEHRHSAEEHDCRALIVLSCQEGKEVSVVAEGLSVTQLHEHREGSCVQVLLVSGSSSKIYSLFSSLAQAEGCEAKYVALH
ncbi:MAG: ribbon-helix-helix domain-containing protein [Acidilobaceae archaeon]|nr:ribbon-helix-helix domain-containing protein [Acidilobaceae archaeon]